MENRKRLAFLATVVAGLMLVIVLAVPHVGFANGGVADSGTVNSYRTYTFVQPTPQTGTGTSYSTVPQTNSAGDDYTRVGEWHSADVFVSAVVTAPLVTTVQFSPDGSNWFDADYIQPTFNSTGTLVENIRAYSTTVTTSAANNHIRGVPVAGEYMRVKMVRTGPITPTIKVTFRND